MNALTAKLFNSKGILEKRCEQRGELPDDSELLRRTLKVAWPSTLESFLIALVSLVDTMMVSSLGDYAIAAVGLCGQPKMIGLAVFFALTTSVSALVARRRGENDRRSAVATLKLALVICAGLTAVVSFLFVRFAGEIIVFAGSEPQTHEYAVTYLRIIMGCMAFNVFSMVINAAQRGAGNTRIAMRTNVASNLTNIAFNWLLINGNLGFPKLGVAGAAIATVIGTVVALAMSVASVMHPDGFIYLPLKTDRIFDSKNARSMVSIGSSTFVEQICLRVGFLVNALLIARLGTTAMATHQIAMNLMTISFSFGDGLAIAAVALVGRSLGERRPDLAQIYGAFCQRCGLVCSLGLSAVYIAFGRSLFALFSKTPEVIATGTIIMRLMTIIVLIQISQVIYSGCLRGSGDTKYTALVSFINISILRPSITYIMCYALGFGVVGAWAGMIIDQSVRLIMMSTRFKRGKWMNITI